jgi:predicted nucleotidyltransferase
MTIDTLKCSTPSREDAVELAKRFERIVEPYGYHIGLTGSVLYGLNPSDIDFIVYIHHDQSICWPKIDIEDLLKLLQLNNLRPAKECEEYETMVFKANYQDNFRDLKIDFLVLELHD